MIAVRGYAAQDFKTPLAPFRFTRRDPGDHDVVIDIAYCGVCHSDLHQARDEWGGAIYPMVPGHEIVGRITQVGAKVTKFATGQLAGVGCMVDSCRECPSCKDNLEQYCERGTVFTYNSRERDGKTPTFGGYSDKIVVDEKFVLEVSPKLPLSQVGPLLCAGITTYSPLRHWKIGPGHVVGIVGLGGLGHMAIKFARAFGAHVVVFTTSAGKRADALRLGAHEVILSRNTSELEARVGSFDFILDTVSAPHDLNILLATLKHDGTLALVGLPTEAASVEAVKLVSQRRSIAGSMIGGIAETQEMLDYCAEHGITSDVEVIPIQQVNEAYERLLRNDVKYRFVIDMASLTA